MRLLKNKKALSTVVTTLIILVVSVLLATVVTFYAINVTTTRVQEESMLINKLHIWYDTSGGWTESGLVLINTGGKDFVIDKIAVRGQESPWANVYYWKTNTVAISADLNKTATQLSGTEFNMSSTFTYQGSTNFTQATTDITVKSGYTCVVYINNPDTVSLSDVGVTIGVTIHTMNAQYYKECNVEAPQA